MPSTGCSEPWMSHNPTRPHNRNPWLLQPSDGHVNTPMRCRNPQCHGWSSVNRPNKIFEDPSTYPGKKKSCVSNQSPTWQHQNPKGRQESPECPRAPYHSRGPQQAALGVTRFFSTTTCANPEKNFANHPMLHQFEHSIIILWEQEKYFVRTKKTSCADKI